MIKHLKSIIVLTAICAVIAVLMAATNEITSPIIEKNNDEATRKSLLVVMPNGSGFEKIDFSDYELPSTVQEVYSEDGGGYVMRLVTSGYASQMIILCGVSSDGTVSGAVCLGSNETLGYEKEYGENMAGVTLDTVDSIDTVSGATMTTAGYRNAVRDALSAFSILKDQKSDSDLNMSGSAENSQ